MKRLTIIVTAFLLAFALPMEGHAQTEIKVGPRIGVPVGDLSDAGGNLFFGADARIDSEGLPITINPSFDYYLTDDVPGGSISFFVVDANALYPFAVEQESFAPYVGGGLGIVRSSVESSNQFGSASLSTTDIELNLVGGASFPVDPVEPFVQANVGIGGDFTRFGIAGGILFSF